MYPNHSPHSQMDKGLSPKGSSDQTAARPSLFSGVEGDRHQNIRRPQALDSFGYGDPIKVRW